MLKSWDGKSSKESYKEKRRKDVVNGLRISHVSLILFCVQVGRQSMRGGVCMGWELMM
jgi:hypothetical protein